MSNSLRRAVTCYFCKNNINYCKIHAKLEEKNNSSNSYWFCSVEHAELSSKELSKSFGSVFILITPKPDRYEA